jgi:hypothetical protein
MTDILCKFFVHYFSLDYHVIERLYTGFGLEIRFIDQFNTQLVPMLNYSAIAGLHNFKITSARAKPCQSDMFSAIIPW